MKKILSKLDSFYIPFDTGKMALFFSILALAYVASASNTPCLSANTCAVGSEPVFEDNVGVKGGTAFTATIDASLITNDRNIQLPDTDGILAVTSTLAGNKMLRTNVSGEIEVDSTTYPVTLSPDLPLYTSATGEVTAGAFDVTLLGVGTGTTSQVLTVGGGSALTWSTITGVPTLTANKPLISDGLGALTTASLTADKIMVTDTNGNLDTTSVYPLSFSANKPVVTDGAGNLTDISLNANENVVTDGNGNLTTATLSPDLPVITDGNGNLTASKLDPETDLTTGTGSAGQVLAVNSGATDLEFIDAGGGGQWTLKASGHSIYPTTAIDGGSLYDDVLICWGGASSTDGVDGSNFTMTNGKQYKIVIETKQMPYTNLNNSSGYNGHGFGYLSDGYDCGTGATCTNCSGNNGYANVTPAWYWYYADNAWNVGNSGNYYPFSTDNDDRCYVLANRQVPSSYGIQGWGGEMILNGYAFNWNGQNQGIKSSFKMNFPLVKFNSPYNQQNPAFTEGTCNNWGGSNQGGNSMYSMSDMYGMYFYDYRPSQNTANSDESILYWLYESNDYSNTP